MATWTCKAGDLHRRIVLDLDGVTTTDASSVVFRMKPVGGGALVVNNTGTIVTSTRVSFTFTGTQLNTPGTYNLEASLIFSDGAETVPTSGYVTVVIQPKLT